VWAEKLSTFVSATSDIVYETSADWREMRFVKGKFHYHDPESPSDWSEGLHSGRRKDARFGAYVLAMAAFKTSS
jgi:hypothetical protein